MEIILLVIASFGPAGFQSIEIHNYDESVSSRKSVDAYLGNDLTITTREGRFALYSSESVGVQKLRSLHGKTVKLRAVLEDTTPAKDSMGQYPAEMDGSPMKRTGYRIISIEK